MDEKFKNFYETQLFIIRDKIATILLKENCALRYSLKRIGDVAYDAIKFKTYNDTFDVLEYSMILFVESSEK